MNSSEIVAKLRDKSAHSAEAFGCEEYMPMAAFWKSYADLSEEAASHIEAQDKLIEELSEALNATTNALEMTTGGQLCLNQIERNRELVPVVKPSSAWPKK